MGATARAPHRSRATKKSSSTIRIPTSSRARDVAAELIRQDTARSRSRAASPTGWPRDLPIETKEAPKQAPPEPGALKG